MTSDEEKEIKSEPEIPITIEDIKIEENMLPEEEYINYEFLRDSSISIEELSDENVYINGVVIKSEDAKTESRDLVKIEAAPRRSRGRPPKPRLSENLSPKSKSHINEISRTEPARKRGRPRKQPVNAGSGSLLNEPLPQNKSKSDSDYSPPRNPSEPLPKNKRKSDSDYSPPRNPNELDPESSEPDSDFFAPKTSTNVINDRMNIKNYKRTVNRPGCIFIDCTSEDTAVIPDLVRIKLLQEYKLYILKSSKACLKHMRDQNWEDLMKCTYDDFTAADIENILQLLKQASQISFDFEKIELIPTRLLRYWMNVNKVQYQRIYDKFPSLQYLNSPKTSLAVYLMYLQRDDVERIATLLQVSETEIMDKIKSVQAIIPCKDYNDLNNMFKLEY